MKIKLIKTYDIGRYEEELEKCYKDFNVDHVDTHTNTIRIRQEDTIMYTAIVFYREKPEDKILKTDEKFNINWEKLNLSTKSYNLIRVYNRRCEDPAGKNPMFYNKKIETINDLIEMIDIGKLIRCSGIGIKTINDIKEAIVKYDEVN